MGAIFLHQLHDHLKSLRFQISLLVLLLFFGASGVIYTWKIDRLVEETARIETGNEQRFEELETLSQAARPWYRIITQALGTEFIAEGGFNWFEDTAWVGVATGNGSPGTGNTRTTNNWMQRFEVVDWTVVTRIVLSFLCIVLAYDAVSGELESGTLRLALANPLSRGRFLVGKFFGHLSILLIATLLGSLLSLLILSLGGALDLSERILRGYGLFLLGTALYLSFFLFLVMGISALARTSASALVVLVLLWAVLIVVIPQTSYMIGIKFGESPGEWWDEQWDYMREVREALEREGVGLRGRELGAADGYAVEQRYARRIREAEKEQDKIAKRAFNQEVRQYKLAKMVNLLSPGFAFQYTVEAFLGTGVMRYENFARQAWQYRDTIRDFLRTRDAADPDSPHLYFFPDYLSEKELDHRNIPRFKEMPLSLAESVSAGMLPILVLVLEAAGGFFFALWAFNRMDLTG